MTNYDSWEIGDVVLFNNLRYGTLITKPVYKSTDSYGLFFADVKWDDGVISKDFMVCKTSLINIKRKVN